MVPPIQIAEYFTRDRMLNRQKCAHGTVTNRDLEFLVDFVGDLPT